MASLSLVFVLSEQMARNRLISVGLWRTSALGLKYLWCIEYVDASEDDVVDDDSLNPYESLEKIIITRPRTKSILLVKRLNEAMEAENFDKGGKTQCL